jgi:hypothetical protein
VVVLEHIHYSDLKSFEIINTFVDSMSLGLIVITVELLENLKYGINKSTENSEKINNNDNSENHEEIILFSKLNFSYSRLISYSSTIYIFMNDYTVEDVDLLLCDILQVGVYIYSYT